MRKILIGIALTAVIILLSGSLIAQEVVVVPKGTPMRLRLAEELQCENSHEGDSIAFEVVDPIKIDGETVIPANALAYGRIADGTTPTRRIGKGGRVAFDLKYVTDITGREIPITEERYIRGRGRGTEIVLGMVSYPLTSPLWLLVEGHHTKFPNGKTIVVVTAAEKEVNLTPMKANLLRNQNPAVTPASTPMKPSTPEYQRAMAAAVQPAAVVNQRVAFPNVYTITREGTLIASR